ncbi:MAG: DUF4089 domain-containing protein [Comamonadaceae bacterium]|nr:MAG: DUF4089 domain-containing protein [Comamonadaceae bacterium]
MTEAEALAYVKASAAALALPLDDARAARVAVNLARTAAMASLLEDMPLAPHDELAEIFRPAPFPLAGVTAVTL